jgi:hypothetical protein
VIAAPELLPGILMIAIIIAHPAPHRNAQFYSQAAVKARGFTFGGKICIMELEESRQIGCNQFELCENRMAMISDV